MLFPDFDFLKAQCQVPLSLALSILEQQKPPKRSDFETLLSEARKEISEQNYPNAVSYSFPLIMQTKRLRDIVAAHPKHAEAQNLLIYCLRQQNTPRNTLIQDLQALIEVLGRISITPRTIRQMFGPIFSSLNYTSRMGNLKRPLSTSKKSIRNTQITVKSSTRSVMYINASRTPTKQRSTMKW